MVITAGGFGWLDSALEARGEEVAHTSPCPDIDPATASHADMLVFDLGGVFLLERGQLRLSERLRAAGARTRFLERALCARYPGDVPLNAAVLGSHLICNPKTVAPEILSHFADGGFTVVPVRQGYTKCSVCAVGGGAVITEDEGIHAACLAARLDSMLISKGNVALEWHGCGFIGGASGSLEPGKVFFTGDIRRHPDFDRIESFLAAHSVGADFVPDMPLTDVGGVISC